MDAVVFAMTRESASNDSSPQQRKLADQALHLALRAERRSRDERTARLRAMLLAIGEQASTED
ncbi:hypothetical protein [Methylobacterium sp. NFXW15]|uniref:hypothetical protein n=1 Tax=Methylobacterium sp. NFXW15 TaxID=2819512 RepID=UPI003CEBE62F